jgi:four helix bundle protein
MQDVTRLIIWHRAVQLAVDVANAIPLSAGKKAPGLRSQALRAARAISEAIAEGCGKNSDWDLARFVDIGCGSTTELQTQLVLAYRHGILSIIDFKRFWRECAELRRMMLAFTKKVRERAERKDAERAAAKNAGLSTPSISKPRVDGHADHPPP